MAAAKAAFTEELQYVPRTGLFDDTLDITLFIQHMRSLAAPSNVELSKGRAFAVRIHAAKRRHLNSLIFAYSCRQLVCTTSDDHMYLTMHDNENNVNTL